MSFSLTSADIARLRDTQNLLLSPLSQSDARAWLAGVCEAVRTLIDADHATMLSGGLPPEILHTTFGSDLEWEYVSHFASQDTATPRALRRGLSVAHLLDVVSAEEFYGSPFYHEFAGPNRLLDPMLLRAQPVPDRSVWVATHQGRRLEESEIRRRKALLEFVLPAFHAGMTAFTRLSSRSAELSRLLDTLATSLLICDDRGRVLHENAELRRRLDADPEGERIREEMLWMAAALARSLRRPDGSEDCAEPTAFAGTVRSPVAGYRLSGTVAGAGVLAPEAVVVVQLEPATAASPGTDELRRRFGLTQREAQVALLLSERLTNREIAEALSISPHTAERHTERVLQKLGTSSRVEVHARIVET